MWEESVAGHGHVVDRVGTPPLVDEVEDGASQAPLVVRVKSAQSVGFGVVNTWEVQSRELDLLSFAEVVDLSANGVHGLALAAHVVQVRHRGNVVAPDHDSLPAEVGKQSNKGIVDCLELKSVDVAGLVALPPTGGCTGPTA